MAQQSRKSTQHARLLGGMIAAANRAGFQGANVSAVIAEAGVSKPTFYDYFADRDDCFRQSIVWVQKQVATAVGEALASRPPEQATQAAARAIVEYAAREPHHARFLTAESMGGGSTALDVRDAGIGELGRMIRQTLETAPREASAPDVPAEVVVGAVQRLLATRLRRGQMSLGDLGADLERWLRSYARPIASARWGSLKPGPMPSASAQVPQVPIQQMPSVLPPGRPRVPEEEIAENHRLRMLYAAAKLAEQKGYNATTVADITRLASVDGRVFYRHFADKRDVFTAAHALGFQHVMDVTSRAFFSVEGWPERCWQAGLALTQLLQKNPLVARVGFVEAYAVGPGAIQRIEESHTAFMFFLQEGLAQRPDEQPPSRVAMEAVIDGIFEIVYLQARGEKPQIARMLTPIAHLWLAPFLGVEETESFIVAHEGAGSSPAG